MLRKNPGFTAVTVVSLALGIGVNCAVFSLTNAALLRDLAVKDPDRLAGITAYSRDSARDFSYPVFTELAAAQQSMDAIAASGGADYEHVVFRGAELQEVGELNGSVVSANYFQMMGVEAAAGRVFTPADSEQSGDGLVVVLGHVFWQSKFGGDSSVLGDALVLDGTPFTIAGIAPVEFGGDRLGTPRDFWVPILTSPRNLLESRTANFFRTIGRLKQGISKEQAEAELTALYRQVLAAENQAGTGSLINRADPANARVGIATGTTGLNPVRTQSKQPLLVLTAVVTLVLLIACANVANLLMARNAARRHEIGLRLALGSSRARLMRQLLTESLLLTLSGAVVGFAVALWGTRLLLGTSAGLLPPALDLRPDWRVFLFTMGVSLLTTVLFGLLPAIQATRDKSHAQLHEFGALVSGRLRQRTSRLLVMTQAGLSLWLLIGAGLLLQSLRNLRVADIGVDRQHVAVFELSPEAGLNAARSSDVMRRISERLQPRPGVRSTAYSQNGLFADGATTAPARVPSSTADASRPMRMGWVSPGFFRTLGMELVAGRDFTEEDKNPGALVGILSESAARHYFGERNPVGELIYFPGVDARRRYIPFSQNLKEARRVEIVGVARDARDRGPRLPPTHGIYLPVTQQAGFARTLYVRTDANAQDLTPGLLQALREFSGEIRVREAATIEEQLDGGLQMERLLARMLGFFGALALALAGVGMYGVMAYAVTRRSGEIGIRMALGARRSTVLVMVLRETLKLVLAGIGLGISAALATTHFLRSALFGLEPRDPMTIAGVAVVLLVVGVLAGYIPARRASRVDPIVALRRA